MQHSSHTLPFPVFDGLTAAASLELSTDGPIRSDLRALAEAYDRSAPRKQARVLVTRTRLKPAAAAAIITTAIKKALLRGNSVTRDDLRQLGLTDRDIDQSFDQALSSFLVTQPALAASLEAA